MLRIYTDGACTNNGKGGRAKASWSCIFPDFIHASRAAPLDSQYTVTNQSAELCAILEGVRRGKDLVPAEAEVRIFTDSQYSMNCLTKWVVGWRKNGWKTSSGGAVVHRELIETILAEVAYYKGFSIFYVAAHTGKTDESSKWNAAADSLARKAIDCQKEVTLEPEEETQTAAKDAPVLEGIPLQVMGGPIEEGLLIQHVLKNLGSLSEKALNAAVLTALKKTLTEKGYELESFKVSHVKSYRLVMKNRLAVESGEAAKEDD